MARAERLVLACAVQDLALVASWRDAATVFACEPGSLHAAAVALVVDELVTNAMVHAVPGYQLTVTPTGCGTVVEVHDGLPDATLTAHGEPYRGLNIVEQLSCQSIWVHPTSTGKSVRAVVPVNAWDRQRCDQ